MAIVVVLGTAGIVYSRDQRQPDNTHPLAAGAGRAGDHWHAAIGFDICGNFAPPVADSGKDPLGIHTHGDGVVHIHPFSAQSSGKKATLGVFFDAGGAKVSDSQIKLPNDDAHKNGQKCDGQPAQVQTKVWGSRDPADRGRLVPGNPAAFRPTNGMLVTIAFVPQGAEIPRPPSADQLDKLTDVAPKPTDSSTSSTSPTSTSSTTPADATSTTVATNTSSTVATTTTVVTTTTGGP